MTFPIQYPRLKLQHIFDWLKPQMLSGAILVAGKLPTAEPNRAIGFVSQPGRGLEMEDELDNPVFLCMSRGGADNYSDAEDIALELDSLFLRAPTNFDIAENVHVECIRRQGGSPTAQPIPDSVTRWVFTCAYVFRVYTNLDLQY
jgi:hypothetical protein